MGGVRRAWDAQGLKPRAGRPAATKSPCGDWGSAEGSHMSRRGNAQSAQADFVARNALSRDFNPGIPPLAPALADASHPPREKTLHSAWYEPPCL